MILHESTARALRDERRRVRATPIVWALAASLYAATAVLGGALGWWSRGGAAAAALVALSLGALALWWRRVRRTSDRHLARNLDAEWALKSRLEAAVELAGHTSAVAVAQRADAADHVARQDGGRTRLWHAGVIAGVLAVALLGTQGMMLGVGAWRRAADARAKAAPLATAAILWRSPPAQIKATAIEEVPLTAHAESTTGFRTLSLEVSVNGDHKVSRPLAAATVEAAQKPGGHEVADVLFMDDLGVKEHDIVSYHLQGEYGHAGSIRTVTSALQFVQVRPTRLAAGPAPRPVPGGEASREGVADRLAELKLEQVRLMERTFAAAHQEGQRAPARETGTLALEQKALATRVREVHQVASKAGAPAPLARNLEAAAEKMLDASRALEREAPREATSPQGRALSLLAEGEKAFRAMAETGDGAEGGGAPDTDPFKERATQDGLTPREETPAGRLERLARRLQQANTQTRTTAAGDKHAKASAAGDGEQTEIAREAEALAREDTIDGEARGHLGEAVRAIVRASREIERGDPGAALEPAMAAEVALGEAVQSQDRVGRATAIAELDRAQRALNAASRKDAGARTADLARIRAALRAAAEGQQQAGSAEAARRLEELARAPGTATPEGLRQSASAAARGQVALSPRAESFNRPVRQLARAPQIAEGPAAGAAPILGDLEVAGQHAEWLSRDAAVVESARRLVSLSDRLQKEGGDPDALGQIAAEAARLTAALETARSLGRRDEVVRHFDPEHVDPAYRTAIETYFERLSREGATRRHAHQD